MSCSTRCTNVFKYLTGSPRIAIPFAKHQHHSNTTSGESAHHMSYQRSTNLHTLFMLPRLAGHSIVVPHVLVEATTKPHQSSGTATQQTSEIYFSPALCRMTAEVVSQRETIASKVLTLQRLLLAFPLWWCGCGCSLVKCVCVCV